MPKRTLRGLLSLLVLGISLSVPVASFALTEFFWPAVPGSPTFSGSGAAGSGGADWDFTNWNTAEFQDLYVGAAYHAAGLDGSAHDLAFAGIAGQVVTYTGTSDWTSPGGAVPAGTYVVPITLELTLTGYGATPWELASVSGADALDPDVGAVADISAGLDFTLTWDYTADLSGIAGSTLGVVNLNDVPQGPPGGQTLDSIGTGWYGVVPEPGTALLFGLGLSGLAAGGRRRAA